MKTVIALLGLFMVTAPLTAQTKYVVNDLGSLGGDPPAAQSINDAGQVAGYANLTPGFTNPNHAFRTAPNSPINPVTDDLGLLGGVSSSASAINRSGQVAATEQPSTGRGHAVLVAPDGTFQNLGDMGGPFPGSLANGINDLGQVTGAAGRPGPALPSCGVSHAFLTAPNSSLTVASDLGALLTCGNSDGYAVNNLAQVVGYSDAMDGPIRVQHAMFWSSSTGMVDLGVLGKSPFLFFGERATAFAINDSGQIVGESSFNNMPDSSYTHAFLTTAAGPMRDIGTLGGNGASARGINNLGFAVGNSTLAGDTTLHAFIYNTSTGVMSDLNTLVTPAWVLLNAGAINDAGQILGCARLSAVAGIGCTNAVRLDPLELALSALLNQLSSPTLGLSAGQINSLTDKLTNVQLSTQQGLNGQAINQLGAFINSVQSWVKTGKISAQTAATLIAAANAIIAALS